MEPSQNLLELIETARANAKVSEDRISDVLKLMGGQNGSETQVEELRAATASLELAAVDIYSVFEARMQHHFRRGPFSRKLKSLLIESGQKDLADKVHLYYLAINVLKHGKGASYRELLNAHSIYFVVEPSDDSTAPTSIVDVSAAGFFDGLTATIVQAYHFLESK